MHKYSRPDNGEPPLEHIDATINVGVHLDSDSCCRTLRPVFEEERLVPISFLCLSCLTWDFLMAVLVTTGRCGTAAEIPLVASQLHFRPFGLGVGYSPPSELNSSPDKNHMKRIHRHLSHAAACSLLLAATPIAMAQVVESTTTRTTSVGTLSEFGPDTIVVRAESSPEPLRYRYTKTTTYVDETGAPVSRELVKAGLPVTVHYAESPDGLVASKVIVRKSVVAPAVATTETTTTRTMGTLTEFSPETIVVRSETSADPLRYSYSKTTTIVDESGAPVSRELMKSGLPITVHYTKHGDRVMATKVIVRKRAIAPAPAVETREERTTTTTTQSK
ncbi:MAG: hypothetical protein ACR2OZ_17460 [Verrucomicrobiales bacterium]